MNKLCLTFLTLALGAPALAHAQDAKTPTPTTTAAAKTTAGASVNASAKITISDQDALGDDILSVINLPIAAADAREAGVDEAELKEALEVTRDSGLSAGDASEVVAEEAEQTRSNRGVKKGFGHWVRMQVALGLRGPKLAAKIKERKKDTEELDEKKLEELKAKLEAQRELNKQWRAKQLEKRGELLAKGKKQVLLHQERNDKLKAKIQAAQDRNEGNSDALQGRLAAIDAKIAAAPEADKAMLIKERERLEKTMKSNEKTEDRLEKAEDKAEKRDEKLDKIDDKLDKADAKLDKLKDKAADKDAKADTKAADRAAKGDAKADAKADDKTTNRPRPGAAAPQ